MQHKLKKGETYKVSDYTPNFIIATYDSYSFDIHYENLEEKNIDWDNVEDIDGWRDQVFIRMADGTKHTLDSEDEAHSDEPDRIQVYNKLHDIIWEYLY